MPKLGESVTEGTISSWLKQVGDEVAFDDPLFEVSTDKVDSEIPSPYDGTLLEILVQADETVPVGTVLARIGDASAPAAAPVSRACPAPLGRRRVRWAPLPRWLQPRVTVKAGCCPRWCAGSLRNTASMSRRYRVPEPVGASVARMWKRRSRRGAHAPPLRLPPRPRLRLPLPPPPPRRGRVKAPADGRDKVEPLSRMRLVVADTVKSSQTLAASVWTSVEVDFHNVDQVRAKFKAQFKKETGASLSYLPFISRAVCIALRAFPTVNSAIDLEAKTMTLHPYVNLGIAVDLDEQGLVVPVVKGADSLNIRGIASEIATKAAAARANELSNKEMTGSTFTITNPGPFASYASAPIINQPNVAILCTDGVKRRPVAVGDAIAIHAVGIIGLVYDHRAFDGSTASKFLLHIRDSLEQRDWAAELA